MDSHEYIAKPLVRRAFTIADSTDCDYFVMSTNAFMNRSIGVLPSTHVWRPI